jgi:hypothetical protein
VMEVYVALLFDTTIPFCRIAVVYPCRAAGGIANMRSIDRLCPVERARDLGNRVH